MEMNDFFRKLHPLLRGLHPSPDKIFEDTPPIFSKIREKENDRTDKSYAYKLALDHHTALSQQVAKRWKKE